MRHVWYIKLHEWFVFLVNVGKYTTHRLYGIGTDPELNMKLENDGFQKDFPIPLLPCADYRH